jgi:hypothetical protein
MSDSVLHRYMNGKVNAGEPAKGGLNDNEEEEDLGSFGWLRGVKERAVMLESRSKDGRTTALDYGWLRKVEFDPSTGIALHFDGQAVRIVGRNLNAEIRPNVRLLRGLLAHRVPWIQEASEANLLRAGEHNVVIEGFKW